MSRISTPVSIDAPPAAFQPPSAGFTQVVEIVPHVALDTLTDYVNEVAGTAIDFPVVKAQAA